jgi:hypothetical protein
MVEIRPTGPDHGLGFKGERRRHVLSCSLFARKRFQKGSSWVSGVGDEGSGVKSLGFGAEGSAHPFTRE